MSDVYNPETELLEQLEALEVEARALLHRLDKADDHARPVLEEHLSSVEQEIERLRRKLRRRRVGS